MMLTVREMKQDDQEMTMEMMRDFYNSDAVDHPVPMETLAQSLSDAIDGNVPMLRGVMLYDDDALAGYALITFLYSVERGGLCVMLEDLFLKDVFRGRRLGQQFLDWLKEQYPQAKRFRLEVTKVNESAVTLYKRCGFEFLYYDQMICERTGIPREIT